MIQIEDLRLVSALSDSRSLSAAARSLRVTPPALSTRLKHLEVKLGFNLAVRSSHRLGLTAEGERFAAEARQLLERLEALPETVQTEGRALSGSLRVCAPFGFGRQHVAPLLGQFCALHPRIELSLDLLETPWPAKRNADVVIHIGEVRDSSWVAHPLAPNERWLCASPAYLKTGRFVPKTPAGGAGASLHLHPRERGGRDAVALPQARPRRQACGRAAVLAHRAGAHDQ